MIRDLAIELGWDRDKFDGFDQSLLDRVAGFIRPSTKPLPSSMGCLMGRALPQKPAAANVYLGPQTDSERVDMRRLMVRVIRELNALAAAQSIVPLV